MPTQKQCAIYVRVSTDAQAEKDFSSCQSQEEKIKSFVASQSNTAPFDGGGAKNSKLSKEKSVFPLNNKFVACNDAAGPGLEPGLTSFKARRVTNYTTRH